jgi:MFS family permease
VTPTVPSRHWRALPAILLGSLLAQFDLFVVNVAAPSVQAGLHATTGLLQLAVGGYSLTYGTLLMTGGRLGDVFGPRSLLRAGMISFAIASGVCALCQTGPELVAARIVQGACAAVMVPQVLALVTRLFTPAERGKATAWFGVTLGLGAVLGQALGGFLVIHAPWGLSWRMIFLVVLPVALPGAWLIGRNVPAESSGARAARPGVDPVGLAGLSSGLLLVFAAVTLAPGSNWPWWGWLLIVLGGLAITATVRWENRQATLGQPAVIDTALFRQGVFRVGLAINSAYFLAFGGVLFVMTYTLQAGLHETAEQSGLTFVPQGAAFAVASLIGVRLGTRAGPRLVTAGALASSTACALLLVQANGGGIAAGPGHLWPVMALLGAGNGLAIPAMIASVLRVVASATSGTAAGVLTTTQQVSMAFGVAVLGAIQTVAVSRSAGSAGYLTGLKITLLAAAVLLALAAAASVSLHRRHPGPPRRLAPGFGKRGLLSGREEVSGSLSPAQ